MGRPEENGPTRYEIITEYIRDAQGPEAVEAFDRNLSTVNETLNLGLDINALQEEAKKGRQEPQVQEARRKRSMRTRI